MPLLCRDETLQGVLLFAFLLFLRATADYAVLLTGGPEARAGRSHAAIYSSGSAVLNRGPLLGGSAARGQAAAGRGGRQGKEG